MSTLMDWLFGVTPITTAAATIDVPVGTAATSEGTVRDLDPVAARAFGINTDTGAISRTAAMRVPGVRRGRNLIVGTIATLPLVAYRLPSDTSTYSRVDRKLFRQLDPRTTPAYTLACTVDDLLFRGQSWWRVTHRDATNYPDEVEHLSFERVNVQPATEHRMARVLVDGDEVADRDLIRFDGIDEGLLTADGAGPTIRLALSLMRGAQRTADDDVPTGKLTLREGPPEPSNEPGSANDGTNRSQVQKLLDDWEAARAERLTAYLNSALDYETVASNAQQRQLTELSEMVASEIARLLNLPASRIGAPQGSGMTYTNTEGDRRDLVDTTLAPYLTAIYQRLSMGDVTPQGQAVTFDLTAYLRGTLTELVTAGAAAVAAGFATRAEVRTQWLGLPPDATITDAAPAMTAAAELTTAAAAGPPVVDRAARTISGLAVPYGPVGYTNNGPMTFAAGSIEVGNPRTVALLREHAQADSIAPGATFEELSAEQVDARMLAAGLDPVGYPGLWATFHVPAGENGDRALSEAESGVRAGLSVGVALDDSTLQLLSSVRASGRPDAVAGRGRLREVSLVSVPAFDAARVAAAAELVLTSWTPAPVTTAAIAAPESPSPTPPSPGTTERNTTMTPEQTARLVELQTRSTAGETLTDAEQAELAALQALAEVYPPTAAAAPAPADAAAAAAAATLTTAAAGPTVVPAVAGAARVVSEPSTYRFGQGGSGGHSIVTDLMRAGMRGDSEARERVEQFNAQLAGGNPASVHAFATAAATRDNIDGTGTDLPSFFQPNPNRPDLMRALVDVKRPFISRLTTIPITNAQPMAIPKVGEFTGVGPHTEGTPHRAAGTLTLSGDVVQPTATSGAWEASRELLDAGNPLLDPIAARAMLRDYQRQSEGKVITLLAARAAQAGAVTYGVDSLLDLRAAMLDFVNDDEEAADIVGVSKTMLRRFGVEVDGVDRPQLPYVTPVNAVGQVRAGYTGFGIDGVEVFRAARLDAGLAAADPSDGPVVGAANGVIARSEGLLWLESNVLQFRFDEVLGPGVVKLALWAYSGAAILDTADVRIISAAASA